MSNFNHSIIMILKDGNKEFIRINYQKYTEVNLCFIKSTEVRILLKRNIWKKILHVVYQLL